MPEWKDNVKFAVYMKEIGDNGTPHYQGYLELKKPQRMSWMKKANQRIHWEVRRGKRGQAIRYCLKDYIQSLDLAREQGEDLRDTVLPTVYLYKYDKTVDDLLKECEPKTISLKDRMEEIKALIFSGASETEIADSYFDIWSRYHRSFTRYRALITKDRDFPTYYIVCQGATGTGKSKYAMENYPRAYWKSKNQWWDGYEGQESVILDEFYGWLPWDTLLRLGDRYPLQTETKGSVVKFCSKWIVITTNSLPDRWYRNVYFPAFIRRVAKWITFHENGILREYDTYDEAKNNFILCE